MFPLVDDKSCLGMGYYRSSCIRCPYGYTEELTSLFSQMGRRIIPVEVPLAALAKQPGSSWGLGTKFSRGISSSPSFTIQGTFYTAICSSSACRGRLYCNVCRIVHSSTPEGEHRRWISNQGRSISPNLFRHHYTKTYTFSRRHTWTKYHVTPKARVAGKGRPSRPTAALAQLHPKLLLAPPPRSTGAVTTEWSDFSIQHVCYSQSSIHWC